MAFLFGKLAWLVIRPSNLLLLLAFLSVLGLTRRPHLWAVRLVTASVLLMTVCTLLPVGDWLLLPLENRFPRSSPDRVDGIIVLGGGVEGSITRARGIPTFQDTMERFAAIPELARRYPDARIIFTGGLAWQNGDVALPETAVISRFLADQGLPPGRVLLEDKARSTRENAVFTLALAKPQPNERWLLVTSASHMPRAMGVFRTAGWSELQPWPVDYRTTGRFGVLAEPVVSEQLDELDDAAYEWFGLLYYRALGYSSAIFPGPSG